MGFDAIIAQLRNDFLVPPDRPGFVKSVPEDGFGAGFSDDLLKNILSAPAAQRELHAPLGEPWRERRERVVQPPARRRTGAPLAGARVVQDVKRDQRGSGSRRRSEGRMVRNAQVIAKPDDRRRTHAEITPLEGLRRSFRLDERSLT